MKLTKYFTREHSLFYIRIWSDAEQKTSAPWFRLNLKLCLFLREGRSNVISSWYSDEEFEYLHRAVANRLKRDPRYFSKILRKHDSYWKLLLPYLTGKRRLNSVRDLKWFYDTSCTWWALMAIIYDCAGNGKIVPSIQKIALKSRSETQHYSNELDRVFIESFKKLFPQYGRFAYVISPEEIFRLNKGSLTTRDITSLERRLRGFALWRGTMYPKADIQKLFRREKITLNLPKPTSKHELRGTPAMGGRARGVVRIVRSMEDTRHIKKGEILVTEMTAPEYVPAMKRVAAIITDEGGMNSHAAIVSREMKKPCIVGTQLATKVLKTGMRVEVDATKGVVKIIRKV